MTDTNELTGRELAVACAEAMGAEVTSDAVAFRLPGGTWRSLRNEPLTIDEAMAWLHTQRDCIILGCYRGKVTACGASAVAESVHAEGDTMTEALQRLVVAVAKRGSKSKETP